MNKQEQDILRTIKKDGYQNQRELVFSTGYSLGMVNKCLQNLHKDGYLNDNNLSKKANDLFDYNKPKNAIILAAGLGIRMIPVNNVYPKALIQIDNETLIERII